jgi:hypothetical protein
MQVYCQYLWEHKYMWQYARICDYCFYPLYEFNFFNPAPRLSQEAMQMVSMIEDWYVNKYSTYISMGQPNILIYCEDIYYIGWFSKKWPIRPLLMV